MNRKQKDHTENCDITHNRKYDAIQNCQPLDNFVYTSEKEWEEVHTCFNY